MSGGSFDHFWLKLDEFNLDLELGEEREGNLSLSKSREELLSHLKGLVPVLKSLEWAESGDSSEADFELALKKFLNKNE